MGTTTSAVSPIGKNSTSRLWTKSGVHTAQRGKAQTRSSPPGGVSQGHGGCPRSKALLPLAGLAEEWGPEGRVQCAGHPTTLIADHSAWSPARLQGGEPAPGPRWRAPQAVTSPGAPRPGTRPGCVQRQPLPVGSGLSCVKSVQCFQHREKTKRNSETHPAGKWRSHFHALPRTLPRDVAVLTRTPEPMGNGTVCPAWPQPGRVQWARPFPLPCPRVHRPGPALPGPWLLRGTNPSQG